VTFLKIKIKIANNNYNRRIGQPFIQIVQNTQNIQTDKNKNGSKLTVKTKRLKRNI